MDRRRATVLAAGLLSSACASEVAPSRPPVVIDVPVVITQTQIERARATLEGARVLESRAVGFDGRDSEPAAALQLLVTLHGAEAYFAALTEYAEGPPALYGLCGLYLSGSPRYAAERERLSEDPTPIDVQAGCLRTQAWVSIVVDGSWTGDDRTFEDYCEHLVVAW